MLLTGPQIKLFWRLWAKACAAQGWDRRHGLNSSAVDARRREFLGRCGFTSLTQVDPHAGFSLVRRELLKLDSRLAGALEDVQPEIESGRKTRWFIEHDLVPCLALYLPDPIAYVLAVAQDKFRWWKTDRPARQITLEDISDDPVIRVVHGAMREFPSQLEQLKMTLAARLNGKGGFRSKAGHSVHDMRTKAGLPCSCAACRTAHPPQRQLSPGYDPANCPF